MIKRPVSARFEHPLGEIAVRLASGPERPPGRPGEDAAAVLDCGPDALLLAVADGMGGQRGGARASKVAVDVLAERLAEGTADSADVVDAVDEAQVRTKASRGAGATTLVVTLITPEGVRMFNVGDSEAILMTPRGKVKVRTTVQSPVGYLVAAGALAPDEALLHEYRHLLSSAVGIDAMRLEVCPRVAFAKTDTLVLGSDGMFDNVFEHELLEITRNRDLEDAADELAMLVAARMRRGGGPPCKPDDMSFILFRPTLAKAASKKKRKKKAKAQPRGNAKAKPRSKAKAKANSKAKSKAKPAAS